MAMSALNRKLIRDLLAMKGQVLAICLVIGCGVAAFVMSLSTLESLRGAQEEYYARYRFADVFAHLTRAPEALEARIREIPGVARLETRIVADVNLDVTGLTEPAVGRLISIPEHPRPGLNELYLRAGRYIEPRRSGEVLVSEAFADAHDLQPGDSVGAVINGRWQRLRMVGIALSPEYVFQIRPGEILPDEKRFGVFWMGEEQLAAAFDMQGAFNDVALTVRREGSPAAIIQQLDRLLEPYGSAGAYDRSEQISNRYLSDEIKQLRSMGLIAPSIFLAVAAFLLNIVLTRTIGTQREQIAALKAFGYTHREVGWHYLKLVIVIVLIGVGLGTLAGTWMGRNLTEMYTRFYRFPVFGFRFNVRVFLLGTAISTLAGVLGTLTAVLRAVRLPPAEAMRPEPPRTYRPTFVERIGLQRLFTPAARMVLRHLERQPGKSALSSLGIAMAVAVLVLGSFIKDAVDYVMDLQFLRAQRQDMTVAFVEPTSPGAAYEMGQLPGVAAVESFRSVPVRLRAGHRERRLVILGIPPENQMYRLLDLGGSEISVPADGVVLSRKLAEILSVSVNQTVVVEVLEGRRPVKRLPVVGLVGDFAGLRAYMSLPALHRVMQEGDLLSGAYLQVDPQRLDELYSELKQTPQVASVTVKQATLDSFRKTIAENLLRMRTFNVIFASIIAVGVVYNSARISLSERSRELATLRVMGFTRGEISRILLGELAVLTGVAVPLGLVLGFSFAAIAAAALNTEMYRIPLVVDRSTYAFAASVVIIAALLSGLLVRRRLDRLDLVAVLKTRE
jgi:putative ABC transport system permease protein